jgi:hypothetical protein
MNRKELVEKWYDFHAKSHTASYEVPQDIRFMEAIGIRTDGRSLTEADGHTPLAMFLRHGDRPLVRLILPNPLTTTTHNLIYSTIVEKGGEAVTVPDRVLNIAGIRPDSIEVVASGPSVIGRSREQVFTGLVRHPVRIRDRWGYWYTDRHEYRKAYFMSGYDRNERALSYFFCELPPGAEPTTVEQAYQSLKPNAVLVAEKRRRKIERQGDMFFIRMPRGWKPQGPVDEDAYVHHSNHKAEKRFIHDGLTYVSGTMRHAPVGRRADHHKLRLGPRWWLCVKNTVPVSR